MARYRLNAARDVDVDGYDEYRSYILNLPYGFRFSDDLVHVRGYDSMAELKVSAARDVIPCDCPDCVANI